LKHRLVLFVSGCLIALAPSAHAQKMCDDLLAAIDDAGKGFAGFRGAPFSGAAPADGITMYEATHKVVSSGTCVVADVKLDNRLPSTSYTCTGVAADTDAALQGLLSQVAECLGVREWRETRAPNHPVMLTSSYGQFTLSLARHGDVGLALGVEAFRDERGEVKGSPVRGDSAGAGQARRCTPKSRDDIIGFLTMYGERAGAERFENDKFVGYTNQVSDPAVAFMTKPNHPAHPAIIVRKVWEENGNVMMSAGGDFAGDCVAFHTLLDETRKMNEALGQQ
jgi:hypothetical protein